MSATCRETAKKTQKLCKNKAAVDCDGMCKLHYKMMLQQQLLKSGTVDEVSQIGTSADLTKRDPDSQSLTVVGNQSSKKSKYTFMMGDMGKMFLFNDSDVSFSSVPENSDEKKWTNRQVQGIMGKFYFTGGDHRLFTQYDPTKRTWIRKSDFPVQLHNVAITAVDNFLYVMGGTNNKGEVQKTMYTFDVTKKNATWVVCPNMPTERSSSVACTIGDKIYLFGGKNKDGLPITDISTYSTKDNVWSQLVQKYESGGGYKTSVCVVGSIIYILASGTTFSSLNTKDMVVKCLVTPSFPANDAREDAQCFALDSKIYAIGTGVLSTYDQENKEWNKIGLGKESINIEGPWSVSTTTSSDATLLQEADVIQAFCKNIEKRGIKCVVFDMDQTLVSAHSQGVLLRKESALPVSDGKRKPMTLSVFKESTSTVGQALIKELLKRKITVSIATFSDDLYSRNNTEYISGVSLVREVLLQFLSKDEVDSIPIVAINPGLYQTFPNTDPRHTYLRERIQTIAEQFLKTNKSKQYQDFVAKSTIYTVTPNSKQQHLLIIESLLNVESREICLIDDSKENIDEANKSKYFGVFVSRRKGLTLEDLTLSL